MIRSSSLSQGNPVPGVLKFHGLITTFEMIMADCPELKKLQWRCVVIDEAHRLKNRNCKLLEGLKLMNLVSSDFLPFARSVLVAAPCSKTLLCVRAGAEGSADGNASAELCGGALQFAELSGAAAVSL